MFNKKIVTTVTVLTLGCGFTFWVTPAFADSRKTSIVSTPIHSIQKPEHDPFTGYVISVDNNSLVFAATSTKDEALAYKNDWWELFSQNKVLRVPDSNKKDYKLGGKLNIYTASWTKSLPPIAGMPTIEKVTQ